MFGRMLAAICAALLICLPAAGRAADLPYTVEMLASGLNNPWGLVFLPGGDVLVTEKLGGVRVLRSGVLDPTPLAGGPPDVLRSGGSGLLDIALDPEFATNGFVYVAFVEGTKAANRTAVWKARYDGRRLAGGTVIFRAAAPKADDAHPGGRLAFLPDKTLLLTTGDGFDFRDQAQDMRSHLGKVLRLDREGRAAKDNPYYRQPYARPELYTWGHRNAQGLLVDPRDGSVWLHEHGPKGGDEINRLKAGANYGWPRTTHGIDYNGSIISNLKEAPGIEPPLVVWDPCIAPSGMALYLGDVFAQWRGDLFVGALAAKALYRVRIRDGRPVEQEVLLKELGARIRDVRQGPDGLLYILTDEDNGRLLRLSPARR